MLEQMTLAVLQFVCVYVDWDIATKSRNRLIGVNQSHSEHVRSESSHIFVLKICVGGKFVDFLISIDVLWLSGCSILLWLMRKISNLVKFASRLVGGTQSKIEVRRRKKHLFVIERAVYMDVSHKSYTTWMDNHSASRCGLQLVAN